MASFLNKLICLHIVKWFQVLQFNISSFINQVFLSNLQLIICLHCLKGFKYCYLSRIDPKTLPFFFLDKKVGWLGFMAYQPL